MKEMLLYVSPESVNLLKRDIMLCHDEEEIGLDIFPTIEGEPVCAQRGENKEGFMYFHEAVITKLCIRFLEMSPTPVKFFSFFEIRRNKKMGWTSLSSIPRRGILAAYTNNLKMKRKNRVFGIKSIDVTKPLSRFRFPLYWTTNPADSVDLDKTLITTSARRDIELLEKFRVLSTPHLLT